MIPCILIDAPFLEYASALELMRSLVDYKKSMSFSDVLIMTEHEPVFSLGRRSVEEDFLAPRSEIAGRGLGVYRVERGGLTTYHGPGQLVVYPVFDLQLHKLGIPRLVNSLEEAILAALSDFGVRGQRTPGHPGVWVGPDKIASIGLAVRRFITFHGISLNYGLDLSGFDLINPCGLTGTRMTSIGKALDREIDPGLLRTRMRENMARIFGLKLETWPLARILELLDLKDGNGNDNYRTQTRLA